MQVTIPSGKKKPPDFLVEILIPQKDSRSNGVIRPENHHGNVEIGDDR
jgi:hypothetical protein